MDEQLIAVSGNALVDSRDIGCFNADFEATRKEFWAFVCRRTKGKYKNIASLKSKAGVSVTSTQGKLEVLRRHYG